LPQTCNEESDKPFDKVRDKVRDEVELQNPVGEGARQGG
jgi:hypothetical protein